MLQITLEPVEIYNDSTGEFSMTKRQDLQLEHSLISLTKWESKWLKPFLSKVEKTREESIDYIRFMTINQNVDPMVYNFMSSDVILTVNKYIELPMTATTFTKTNNAGINREVITAEIIYYWMISFNIPFECQKWHLNRLLTLINVCNIKNQPAKKMSTREVMARNRALNEARRARLNTPG